MREEEGGKEEGREGETGRKKNREDEGEQKKRKSKAAGTEAKGSLVR